MKYIAAAVDTTIAVISFPMYAGEEDDEEEEDMRG
jgi:hypothetical protein